MKSALGFSVIAALSGCVVLPTPVTTSELVASEPGRTHVGAMGAPTLSLELHDGTANVRVMRNRRCYDLQHQTIAVHRSYDTHIEMADLKGSDSGYAILVAAMVGFVTLPVSAAITGIVVVAGSGTDQEHRDVDGPSYSCPAAAPSFPVEVVLQHGEVSHVTTDTVGVLAIPFAAEVAGPIVVRAYGLEEVTNFMPANADPGLVAVRDAIAACGKGEHLHATTVTSELVVDETGHVAATIDLGNPKLAACIRRRTVVLALAAYHPMTLALAYRF